jgi:hypothetical protein
MRQPAQGLAQTYANERPPAPTDMQKLIRGAENVAGRLGSVHSQLSGLIGRLYGEGANLDGSDKTELQSVGAFHTLTASLYEVQVMIEKLEVVTKHLSQRE